MASESDESEILELDVGGVVYKTTKHTLLSAGDAYFSSLFSGNWSVKKDKNGKIFIDRDGEPFRYVLEYLRNKDQIVFPESMEMKFRVHREAEFYGLTELKEMVENELEEDKTSYDIVDLNVGGVSYTTTRGTLTSEGSYFRRLFSKKGNSERKFKNGILFIDRDGEAFQYILRHLQVFKEEGESYYDTRLTKDEGMMSRVKEEARFYGIDSYLFPPIDDDDDEDIPY